MIDPVDLLCDLIAIPTQQAGASGTGGDERALCEFLAPKLRSMGADEVSITDAPRKSGGPGAYIFARWGTPRTVLNAHIDTVPANTGWRSDPWTPIRTADTVTGLGSCDTKGAIAAGICAIAAMPSTARRDMGLLFSGDEEHGTASVDAFLQSPARSDVSRVIVCEPTGRKAGIAHRGVLAYRAKFQGEGGHSSKADHLSKPVAAMARLATLLDDYAVAQAHVGPAGMTGLCVNIAQLIGGVAFNVIPTDATLMFSLRPAPGFDIAQWRSRLAQMAASVDPRIVIEQAVDHAPFASLQPAAMSSWAAPHVLAVTSLDFWTEAALYASAGIDAVVIGPGDIAQAHTANEWVAIADLHWAVATFTAMLGAP
jgi:acetylornithine deacetylase